jgi:hypothetical protein
MSSIFGSNLHKLVLPWVARKYAGAVSFTEAFQKAAIIALQTKYTTYNNLKILYYITYLNKDLETLPN